LDTYNHTLTAVAVALLVQDQPLAIKVAVGVALVLSHPFFDGIPHLHLYNAERLKEKEHQLGALIELGGGLIFIPLMMVWLCGINPWLILSYVAAASAFDALVVIEKFLVADAKKRWIKKINHLAHFWEWKLDNKGEEVKRMSPDAKAAWEIGQTVVLIFLVVFIIIFRGAP